MNIRNIKSTDICEIVELWNEALPHEVIDKKQFVKKVILDPNFTEKGFFVAEEDGKIQGFLNAPFYKSKKVEVGCISIMAIRDRSRVGEIGDILLETAENYLRENGKTHISTGYAPIYFTQGVEKDLCPEYVELYRSRGYAEKESYKRVCDLSLFTYPEKSRIKKAELAKEGIYIGEMKDEYILSLIDRTRPFAKTTWTYEFKQRLAEMDYARIRIAAKDGEVIGCCVFGDPTGSPERFGPFGVNSDTQGKGIGSILLHDCFQEMKKRGLQCAWAQWTPVQGAAHTIYERYGFTKRNAYYMFEKDL